MASSSSSMVSTVLNGEPSKYRAGLPSPSGLPWSASREVRQYSAWAAHSA
ncbi:MAG: hypothetical protein IPI35_16350 [Deltaproteobacteria bacterium]|nr:hypothetical protein [Deltaproteobacteria bacterium]